MAARNVALVCLVLAVGLSACLNDVDGGGADGDGSGDSGLGAGGTPDGSGQAQPREAQRNHTLRASGCDYIYLETRTTVDKVADYLPPGFSFPQPYTNTPLVVVDHHVCDKVVVDNETEIAAFAQGRLTLWVSPPDDIAPPDDYSTSLMLQTWVSAEDVLAIMVPEGIPAALGTTTWEATADNPLAFVASGAVQSGESGEQWRFETLADAEKLQETQLRRVYVVDHDKGNVSWFDESRQGDGNWRDYGGVLMPAQGSLLSELTVNPILVETTNDVGTSMDYHVELGRP